MQQEYFKEKVELVKKLCLGETNIAVCYNAHYGVYITFLNEKKAFVEDQADEYSFKKGQKSLCGVTDWVEDVFNAVDFVKNTLTAVPWGNFQSIGFESFVQSYFICRFAKKYKLAQEQYEKSVKKKKFA